MIKLNKIFTILMLVIFTSSNMFSVVMQGEAIQMGFNNMYGNVLYASESPEELSAGTPVTTCKDLESIGKGSNYEGASHTDAWGLGQDYVLTDDIDCSASNPADINHDTSDQTTYGVDGFDTIGSLDNTFTGNIHGDGHSVDNLYINSTESAALINTVEYTSTIDDLHLNNVNITGGDTTGSIASINNGNIINSSATGTVSGTSKVGGLVGRNYVGTVSKSYSDVTTTGASNVGGLVGSNENGNVTNTYSTGEVIANENVGGLVGSNGMGNITNTYSISDVSGTSVVGGLVGLNQNGNITNSYAAGDIDGVDNTGALMGYNNKTISNSYGYEAQLINGTSVTDDKLIGSDNAEGNSYSISTFENLTDESNFYNDKLKWTASNWITGQVSSTSGNIIYPHLTSINVQREIDIEQNSTTDPVDPVDPVDPEGVEVSSCKDLESIGKGEDYPGASHEDAWSLDGDYYLTEDIDCTETTNTELYGANGFDSIAENSKFNGTIDGNDYSINNLYTSSSNDNTGVISTTSKNAEINNLNLNNINVNSPSAFTVGGLVGNNWGKITNSSVSGNVKGYVHVGAIAGENRGTITNSSSSGSVQSSSQAGGLVGVNRNKVNSSYSSATVSATDIGRIGGLVGVNFHGKINNSYATGDLNSDGRNVGGLVGDNSLKSQINNSYATGDVNGTSHVGGLVGRNRRSEVNNSYAAGDVTSRDNYEVGTIVGLNKYGEVNNSYTYEEQMVNGKKNINGVGNNFDGTVNVYKASKDNLSDVNNFYADSLHWDKSIWSTGQVSHTNGKVIYPHINSISAQPEIDIE